MADLIEEMAKLIDYPLEIPRFKSHELTIVTGIFDLSRRQKSVNRGIQEYLNLGKRILNLPMNMFIGCDVHLVKDIFEYRRSLGFADRTYIYAMDLEKSPYYQYRSEIEFNFNAGRMPQLYDPIKMTPLYLIIGWSRFHIIDVAIKTNLFNSGGMVWVDFGVMHLYPDVELTNQRILNALEQCPRDRIKALLLEHTHLDHIADLKKYYYRLQYKVATGFYSGPIHLMRWLIDEFNINLLHCLRSGYPSLEEAILNITCTQYPEKFEFYYGNYVGVIYNACSYHDNFYQISITLIACRDIMRENVIKIAIYMLRSEMLPVEKLKVLDELFLALWFGYESKGGRELARKVADQMADIIEEYGDQLSSYLTEHYGRNLNTFGYKLEYKDKRATVTYRP